MDFPNIPFLPRPFLITVDGNILLSLMNDSNSTTLPLTLCKSGQYGAETHKGTNNVLSALSCIILCIHRDMSEGGGTIQLLSLPTVY